MGWKKHKKNKPPAHRPDCSAIGDEQLRLAIGARWPSVNGITRISYSFSPLPLLRDYMRQNREVGRFLQAMAGEETVNILRPRAQAMLQEWSDLSQGRLQFFETSRVAFLARGIFIIFADKAAFAPNKILGQIIRRFDNDLNMLRAYVFLQSNLEFWNETSENARYLRAARHELGHGVGFDHLHEFGNMHQLLRQTPDGVYCSVMPYLHSITTNISRCLTHGETPFAIAPGPLDKRLVELAFIEGVPPSYYYERFTQEDAVYNLKELFSFSLCFPLAYKSLFLTLGMLPHYRDRQQSLFSRFTAEALTDFLILFGMAYGGFSIGMMQAFCGSMMLKYLAGVLPLPNFLSRVLNVDLSLLIFNLWCVNSYGHENGQIYSAVCAGSMATILGSQGPLFILENLSRLNPLAILRAPLARLTQNEEDSDEPSSLIAPATVNESRTQAPPPSSLPAAGSVVGERQQQRASVHPNGFFFPRSAAVPRRSACTRFMAWLGYADPQKDELQPSQLDQAIEKLRITK